MNEKMTVHKKLYHEIRKRLPMLAIDQQKALSQNRLGFSGSNNRDTRTVYLLPTPLSPCYWLWNLLDSESGVQQYTPRETAASRLPWNSIKDIVSFRPLITAPSRVLFDSTTVVKNKQPSHLYVIQADWGGPIKIGQSLSPQDRVNQLQIGNPYPLLSIRVYEYMGYLERDIHNMLKDYRLHGEWFCEEALYEIDRYFYQGVLDHGNS